MSKISHGVERETMESQEKRAMSSRRKKKNISIRGRKRSDKNNKLRVREISRLPLIAIEGGRGGRSLKESNGGL